MGRLKLCGFDDNKAFVYSAPPSKSYTHRYMILAAEAGEGSQINNPSISDDTLATLLALEKLGAKFKRDTKKISVLTPMTSKDELIYDADTLNIYCKDSASTLRFIAAQALRYNKWLSLSGSEGLSRRSVRDYIDFFEKYGIEYEYDNALPLRLKGEIKSGCYDIAADVSSQYASALMLYLASLRGISKIRLKGSAESRSYLDITASAIRDFGRNVDITDNEIVIGGGEIKPAYVRVEGDYSQAAFFIALSATRLKGTIRNLNPSSAQGDKYIMEVLKKMSINHSFIEDEESESGYSLIVEPGQILPCEVDIKDCPDLAPVIALLMSLAEGTSIISSCRRLRYKESDRLFEITRALKDIGADIKIIDDSMIIRGVDKFKSGRTTSSGDHRIAMMIAVAAGGSKGEIILDDFEAVNKSYPNFWKDYRDIGGRYEECMG